MPQEPAPSKHFSPFDAAGFQTLVDEVERLRNESVDLLVALNDALLAGDRVQADSIIGTMFIVQSQINGFLQEQTVVIAAFLESIVPLKDKDFLVRLARAINTVDLGQG